MYPFRIVEHLVPCQHIREYPQAVVGEQETVLQLQVKQYIPLDNPNPQPGDITIIGAHANAFPKELYEPLWEDLLAKSKKHNFRIRSIWVADVAQQGWSGVLNEDQLGNDPNWNDHARDLLHLINMKRDQMPRPIIGIGHSMGGNNLVNLSLMHPRLLSTLVLIDPVISPYSSVPKDAGPNPAQLSTFRRDVWPSREAAAKSYKTSKFYQKWDSRVLDRWIQNGLRELPTPTHSIDPNTAPGGTKQVTLTTTRHQEVFTFLRPTYNNTSSPPSTDVVKTFSDSSSGQIKKVNLRTHPDLNPLLPETHTFYRPEPPSNFFNLSHLRPSVLYIFGSLSDVGTPENCAAKMATTGTGVGGSGGAELGRVKSVMYDGVGHLIAMEAVDRTAEDSASWIGKEMERWRKIEQQHIKEWIEGPKTKKEKQMVDETWMEKIGGPPGRGGGKVKKETKL